MPVRLLLALALAADPAPPDIPRAVRDLGADDYATREKATRLLWAAGPPAEAALRAALGSNDAEVVARARRVLDLIARGVRPDDPPDLVRAAAEARADLDDWPRHVAALLDFGPRGLEVAAAILDRHPDPPGRKAARRRTLDAACFRLAPALIAAGRDGDAEAALERAARAAADDEGAARHYAAFLAARGRLGDRWPHWREAFQRDGQSPAVAFALARLAGDHAVARAAAERIGNAEAIEAALFDAGAWAELADVTPAALQPAGYTAVRLGLRANYLRLAGHDARADAALDELRSLPVVALRLPAPPFAFQALMYNRRPADALAALAKLGTPAAVAVHFEVLMQLHRDAEAQALLDSLPDTGTPARWHLDAARLRAAHRRGDAGRFDAIVKAAQPGGRPVEPGEVEALADFVETLAALGREAEALPFAAALLAAPDSDPKKWAERFEKAAPKAPLAWEAWWTLLGLENPGALAGDTVARIPALCDARLREPAGRAQLAAAEAAAGVDERLLRGLGEACQAAGLDGDAARLYAAAAQRSPAGWLKLGDLHAERGRWPAAADAYGDGARADPKAALPLWLAGWARAKAGRAGGAEAMARAHALPLADDKERIKFADEMAKRSHLGPEPGDAARRERRLVLRLATPGSAEARAAQSQLSSDPLAYADRREAAAATDRFLLRMLRSRSYFKNPTSYVTVLVRRDVQRAAGLLAAGDLGGAAAAAEAAQELSPANPTPASVVAADLAKRGRGADADRLYATAATALDKVVADHPRSGTYAANRAWLAARCRRDLDAALRLARKATELSPADAAAWEALAEVRLQRGEAAESQAAARRCAELSPRSAYYARFAARAADGDRDAPLPDGVLR